jgi:hypothetical protein
MGLLADIFLSVLDEDHSLTERWKQIPEHEDYWVSTQGRVWSEKKRRGSAYGFLTPYTNESGRYLVISLYKNGERKQRLIHGMVASCFLGERPEGHEVHHINGDTRDNRVANLEYRKADENTSATEVEDTGDFAPKDAPF